VYDGYGACVEGIVRAAHPFRLPAGEYRGPRRYFLTICTDNRRAVFLDLTVGYAARDVLTDTSARYGFAVVAYCFMPDHLHALVEGQTVGADCRKFVCMYKQRSGFAYRRESGARLWQRSYFDHVLRGEEGLLPVTAYILGNPVRAGLCQAPEEYPLLGSDRYSLEALAEVAHL
jgi:putative transposase